MTNNNTIYYRIDAQGNYSIISHHVMMTFDTIRAMRRSFREGTNFEAVTILQARALLMANPNL